MTRTLPAVGLLAMIAACTSLGRPPTNAPSPTPTGPPTSPPTEQTSAPPPTVQISLGPTITPWPLPSATPSSVTPPSGDPMPPDASLTLPDGTQRAGALGSFFYGGAAADAPWLPARVLPTIEVPAGSSLVLAAPPLEFLSWGARYADAADEDADVINPLASGGDDAAPSRQATLPVPPSGSWVVAVQLFFADEEGDATYYWHVTVP